MAGVLAPMVAAALTRADGIAIGWAGAGLGAAGADEVHVDPVTAEPMPLGEPGEIILRSPSITTGYWRNPEATARQLRDGWLHTGDTGYLDDDGCLHYLARAKDMIKVSGMSVFPAEVETLLVDHPDVATVAVVPAPDPETGERPVAFIEPQTDALCPEALAAWVREALPGFMVPDAWLPWPPQVALKPSRKQFAELARRQLADV